MLYNNVLLILFYIFTLRSCDWAAGVCYLISIQARRCATIVMDYTILALKISKHVCIALIGVQAINL